MKVELLDYCGSDEAIANAARLTKTQRVILEAYKRGYRVTQEGLLLNKEGRVKSVKLYGNQRYPTFTIHFEGRPYGIPIHQLAAYCFYGEQAFSGDLVVRHINGNTSDISFNNIKLGTHSDNNLDKPKSVRKQAAEKARASQGYEASNRKLSQTDAVAIRTAYAPYLGRKAPQGFLRSLANRFNVSTVTILNVKNCKNYQEVRT